MLSRPLPRNPDLKRINDEARHLLHDFRQGNASALARYSHLDSLPATLNPRLAEVRHMIAREYGYASWPKLVQHLDELARDSDSMEELIGL